MIHCTVIVYIVYNEMKAVLSTTLWPHLTAKSQFPFVCITVSVNRLVLHLFTPDANFSSNLGKKHFYHVLIILSVKMSAFSII